MYGNAPEHRKLTSGFSSLVICLFTHIHVYRNTPIYLGHCLLGSSVEADFVSPCLPVLRRWSSRFSPPPCFFLLSALAKGFIAYYPGMRPCFDLNFPVLCCLVVWPSSMAPLTGLLENRTPFILVLIPRERRKLCRFPRTLVPWVGLPDFAVLVKLWRVTVGADQLKWSICNSTSYSLVFHLDLFLFLYQIL